MLKLFRDQKGFTLVELMIVVVIVGILAAVAIPMYRGSVDRAKASEAVAALGSIRSALRVYYGEHATYVFPLAVKTKSVLIDKAGLEPGVLGWGPAIIDLDTTDLMGRYFDYHCYTFDNAAGLGFEPTATDYSIEADGGVVTNVAPKEDEVTDIKRYIDQDGEITK